MGIKDALLPPDQPRWLTAAFAPALVGHGVAGFGLYWDIAWHIDAGRDEKLLTAPHTLILAGLLLIAVSACAGLYLAAREGRRLPRGLLAAAFAGGMAVIGFPLDELWHSARGRRRPSRAARYSPAHADTAMSSRPARISVCGAV
ncbi:MAG TPA: hypothetical protein VNU01_06495, partial [Egibacteraceae bacterium]|nr:hypothetical protein [Egibacteraceae bacterium]